MYKGIFEIQSEAIDNANLKIHAPFMSAFFIHSGFVSFNGLTENYENIFEHQHPYLNVKGGLTFNPEDSLVLDINYFYINPEKLIFDHLVDVTYSNQIKSNQIASKHYIEGQFSLDNGLYKNAALNYGVTIEALLNKQLDNSRLNDLINGYTGAADSALMHNLRNLRNKVHPNLINNTQDIYSMEAHKARNELEKILAKF